MTSNIFFKKTSRKHDMISKLRDSISPEKGFVYIVYRLYVTWWFNQFDQITILQP